MKISTTEVWFELGCRAGKSDATGTLEIKVATGRAGRLILLTAIMKL